jgi:hypothetical protein
MLIAIPSKGRAGAVKSQRLLPAAHVFVPELEVDAYRRAGAQNVVGVPNEIRGITRTRNWILDYTDDRWVLMVDDDVKAAGWVQLQSEKSKHRKLTPDDWTAEIVKLFDLTESLQYRIFGVATQSAPRSVYPYKPFLWRSYVTASFMGIVNDGRTRFDEAYPVKEDYELNLRCIVEDGGVVCARHIYWENSHWTDDGGCKDYRSDKMERDCIKRLAKQYPGMIRAAKRENAPWTIEIVAQ